MSDELGASEPFVPAGFEVPRAFERAGFRLEPLGPEHNERDHAAWMSSIDHIRATPGFPDGTWPREMSLEQNLADLNRHAAHFEERRGFTYSVLDGDQVIGCLYIYPTSEAGFDAEVSSWVTEGRADLDVVVWRAVSEQIAESWPFVAPCYALRG